MKTVKIIKARPTYWYANHIGQEFDVIEDYGRFYKLSYNKFIDKKDCVDVVKEHVPDDLFEL